MPILPNNLRAQRGLQILAAGQVQQISRREFEVLSQSGNGTYCVVHTGEGWICTCVDNQAKQEFCKHIWAVELGFKVRHYAAEPPPAKTAPPELAELACNRCGGSSITRKGTRISGRGRVQRFRCTACRHRFILPDGFERHRATPKAIVTAFDLWAKKVSYRQIAHHLDDVHGVQVGKSTIERWIRKLAKALATYCDGLQPMVGPAWHSDETTINTNGKLVWTWNVMDNKTRFWLASTITRGRSADDARKPLRQAKKVAGRKPHVLITDGLQSYPEAVVREYYNRDNPTTHLVIPPIRGLIREDGSAVHPGNNILERLQGTQRERTKVMRGFERPDSAQVLLDGLRGYYNLIRPHMGLAGQTPAMAAGIQLPAAPGEGMLHSAAAASLKRKVTAAAGES